LNFERYNRQIRLQQVGEAGQAALARSRVLVIGCGAIGSVVCDQLSRAGVGSVHVVDRDIVDWTNLQRQVLFDETDAENSMPKAVAAAERMRAVNRSIEVVPHVLDVVSDNIEALVDGAKPMLVIDGSDNAELRYLINEVCVKLRLPWIYGACIGVEGRVMAVMPGTTACLRCVFPKMPVHGELPTCDTVGVLGASAGVVGSIQAAAAIRYLVSGELERRLLFLDVWRGEFRSIDLSNARNPACPVCVAGDFPVLHEPVRDTTSLCGANTVQLRPRHGQAIALDPLAERLSKLPGFQRTKYFVRAASDSGLQLTIFSDGRILVRGTEDFALARSVAAKVVGL
jgi:adenylyltransferase/sulfurtransferase